MKAISILLTLIWIIALPSLSISDSVDYLYDDNGRLVKASKTDNTRILYQYDKVGNLIGTYKETSASQALPPVLQGIDPDILLIDETYNVIISGQNLLTTTSVTSDNPDITINFIAAIDSKIIAVLSIADTALLGTANITVTTSYGFASLTINLYGVNITPEAISLFPGSTATMSVSLTPSATRDVTVEVNNKTPDIIDMPSSVTIPLGGSGNFTVKAIKGGTGTINIGNAEATVYVIGGDDDSRGAIIESAPVSVSSVSGPVPDNSLIQSLPVTVSIDSVVSGTILSSNPVSVIWQIVSVSTGTAVSSPVSMQWTAVTVSDAITVSLPVGVEICSNYPVRVMGTTTNYYSTLQAAYDSASDNETIQAQALTVFTENLNINRNVSVVIEGGYNCAYSAGTGKTELKGIMTISGGTVKVKNFILKK